METFLAKITQMAQDATSKFIHAQLRGDGDEGDDSTAEPADDSPFIQQAGLAARAKVRDTLRGLAMRFGEEVWLLKVWDKAKLPSDLEEGETRLYGVEEPTSQVRLRGNGDLEVTAKTGQKLTLKMDTATVVIDTNGDIKIDAKAGQNVIFNGGSDKVAVHGDSTQGHSHTLTGTAGPYPVSGSAQNATDTINVTASRRVKA
jgi:hypothetical protein